MGYSFQKASIARLRFALIPLSGCLLLGGCTSLSKGDLALDMGVKDRGVASWYGKEFHGKQAANGELFDMTAYTAAHRKLPLGTVVRVLNVHNGKSVRVRINDRGPYVTGRMLDLSQAAAQELGMVESGTTVVQIEVVGEHRAVPPMPLRKLPLVAGAQLALDPATAPQPNRSGDDMAAPTPVVRMMPNEVLFIRRERGVGSMLAADYNAHNIVPVLCVA